jgi:hypothetical protein
MNFANFSALGQGREKITIYYGVRGLRSGGGGGRAKGGAA